MSMAWHIEPSTWQAYADGLLGPAVEAAVETHVTSCAKCQDGARQLIPDVGPVRAAVHAAITQPRLPWPLRALARLGVPRDDLVLLAAADDLAVSWAVSVGAAISCSVVAALTPPWLLGGPDALFLILAPLIPALAVVASYDATDPLREVTEVSPYSKLRVGLLRTAAALTAAVPATFGVALLVPPLSGVLEVWLLPGLALAMLTLVLMTWLSPWSAAGVVGVGWVLVASAADGAQRIEGIASPVGQGVAALALLLFGAWFVQTSTSQRARGVSGR